MKTDYELSKKATYNDLVDKIITVSYVRLQIGIFEKCKMNELVRGAERGLSDYLRDYVEDYVD